MHDLARATCVKISLVVWSFEFLSKLCRACCLTPAIEDTAIRGLALRREILIKTPQSIPQRRTWPLSSQLAQGPVYADIIFVTRAT
jgi:hypothetical protein